MHRQTCHLCCTPDNVRQFSTVPAAAAPLSDMYEDMNGIMMKGVKISGRPLCLDMQATTPVDPLVTDAMLPYYMSRFGARTQVAALINASPREIIFTSGAIESNNISQEGFDVTYLPVESDGIMDLEKLRAAIRPDTGLVSVNAANNEIGVIQPIEEIGRICKEHNIPFHTHAAQAFEDRRCGGEWKHGEETCRESELVICICGGGESTNGIQEVAVSSGSECTSASLEPSYVLRALRLDEDMAHTSLRFGIGRFTTEAERDGVVELTVQQVVEGDESSL
ncbi:cysteine desulfurase [Ancistrocladus abbreviatus]